MSVYQKFIESANTRHVASGQHAGSRVSPAAISRQPPSLARSGTDRSQCCQPIRPMTRDHIHRGQLQEVHCLSSSPRVQDQCHRQQQLNMHTADKLSILNTDDPMLIRWLQAMRFETKLECMSDLKAGTLTIDVHSAGALSVRNSQVFIQEMRAESNFIIEFIDYLIEKLPLEYDKIHRFQVEFTEIWKRLVEQTNISTGVLTQQQQMQQQGTYHQDNLTITNCTPRKSVTNSRLTMKPLNKLATEIRNICVDLATKLNAYLEIEDIVVMSELVNSGDIESSLRKLKELFGRYIEISIRAECANIVRALDYDFSQASLNRLSSTSSLRPVRPFESSNSQLPLKWALIALWQLTNDDSYICRTLTEKWQTSESVIGVPSPPRAAKRLDYSTKYDRCHSRTSSSTTTSGSNSASESNSLRDDYQKLYLRQNNENSNTFLHPAKTGALNNALNSKQAKPVKEICTIELLIDIIISQPNKHERLDMMNFIHMKAQHDKLVDIDELDQSYSAAIYTSNQYKVAALRILNHLCVNDQAVKTILRCFSTPPPSQGQPVPENKIIRSIFECFQSTQEHIYQNEAVFKHAKKRISPMHVMDDCNDYTSDYGSRKTSSIQTANDAIGDFVDADLQDNWNGESVEDGDDAVVKEAIRLLVQLTTSFHRSNQGQDYYTLIGRFSIESLVKYLTNIISSTNSREILLLSLTALANISFITTEPMKTYGTTRTILEMFRVSKDRSKDLELRDQAVTILANSADKNLLDIVTNGGLNFLLSCLESCPTKMANYRQGRDKSREHVYQALGMENKPRDRRPIDFGDEQMLDFLECACDNRQFPDSNLCLSKLSCNELAALERIHQKTAVAFARMSADPSTTRLVLRYKGVRQMIDLCKFAYKRNHSDTVLIACIAALRKMAKVIGTETFRYYSALDLIELELNQALEIYGNPRVDNRMFTTVI